MKKLYIFSFLLIFTTCNIFSQSGWFWQNPLPQGNDLNTVEITPNGNIFSGGYSGTILKSTDNCQFWEVKSNVNQYQGWFHDIVFLDNNTGWTVGQDWGIYYTNNSGFTWNQKYLNSSNIFYDIYFKTRDTAWACGTSSHIIKTTNNWQSYTIQYSNLNQSYHFKSISFFDNNSGICVGSTNSGTSYGVMYVTSNSGNLWQQINSPVFASLESIVCFSSGVSIIVTGQGGVLRSTDRGNSWSHNVLNSDNAFNEVFFLDQNTGWIAGNSGKIYKTTDQGISWNLQSSQTMKNINSIKFSNSNTGYAVGDDGSILKTTNGGINWNSKTSYLLNNENNIIQTIKFLDIHTGYLFGYTGLIAKSTDGGTSWTEQQSNTTSNLMRSFFIDGNNIWAAGYNGTLIKTTNGGSNWNVIPFPNVSRITGIHFPNNNTGYILTQSPERILKTSNSGLNWFSPIVSQQIQYGNNILFINPHTGFIVGNSGLINKTENGGLTWTSYSHTPNMNLYDIYFMNTNTGWVCGDAGIILKTTNSGANWAQQNIGGQPLLKIMFVDEDNGWGAGFYGRLLKTTNGGQNWQFVLTGTYVWLQDVNFIDANTGWIVGGNSILKTTTGGTFVGVQSISSQIPKSFFLHQNYPNPFNPVTKIKFEISFLRGVSAVIRSFGEGRGVSTKVIIYDLLGREVTTLVNEQLKPGTYEVDWDGTGFASGVYFYSLVTDGFVETKRMVLIK